ncbi:DNA methyltransferase [Aliiroseovarius sp. xm-v-208]|uniref:class I SAM-dependent DNA methyltransferase n=1 Tax=Aliiroseovarius sp. xm-v-208 TaxID=2651835 RepID=UPI001568F7C1|nr:DNA methyltransferase [Aliiroseovarius sp. xm-v-208]NRQ09427.1 hypothetical protein [Aliiroseovarius sp. xm-v-208]
MNVVDIEENVQDLVSKGFKPDTFILDFVKAYDAPKALIQQLKGGHQNLSDVPGAVLWRRNLHYKLAPKGQVAAVIAELERSQATSKYKARFVISTDGDEFSARDLVSGNTINCHFDELAVHFASFLSLAGIFIDEAIEENPIDIKATKRLTKFYDSILQDNPAWKTDEMRHTLNHFITQVIFCLFAEDTGIIADNIFTDTIRTYCESDSEQAQPVITAIFTAMAHPEGAEVRSSLPAYAKKFPHVNGGLFRGSPQVPRFLRGSVRYLMDAGALDWKEINPDIFGSMIQAIVHQDQRGELGMHYTSVSNILKLLKPLFLNDLQEQVQSNWNSKKGLQNVLQRLMKIRVFDPACGSGNFLVIAYRELRNIEIQVIRRLAEISDFSAGVWSHVELKNFFGIEYIDFAAETAKLSLWIAEYQMNKRYEDEFGKLPPSLPLKDTNNIRHGNALRIAWDSVCPHSDDPEVETYIVGNPPYLGSVQQTNEQKQDMELVFSPVLKSFLSLDYVSAWLWVATQYLSAKDSFAFVTTNSVCQGTHVESLWKHLITQGLIINFAHTSFKWKNNASKNAGVSVIVVGASKTSKKLKKIYTEEKFSVTGSISPYLTGGVSVIVEKSRIPLNGLPEIFKGNQATDGGNLILNQSEAETALNDLPEAKRFIKKYVGSDEIIKSTNRYCLFIHDNDLDDALSIPFISKRVDLVRKFREQGSEKSDSIKLKDTPWKMRTQIWSERMMGLPIVFSERRKYMSPVMLDGEYVISNLAFGIPNPEIHIFSIASSKLILTWVRAVCGQLETRIRFSNTMGWNTFPVPDLTDDDKAVLTKCAEDILLARDHYFEHTLENLYDPKNMENKFPELWEAHQRNDEVLETIYNGKPFENDTERLEHLFARYVEMTSKSASKQKGAKK